MRVLRVLGGLQHSPHQFIPVHQHLGAFNTSLTIWDLPEEILVHLLKSLHIRDLLSMRQVHSHFRSVIDGNQTVWASVSFREAWPSLHNLKHFERAAEAGNIEALIKLAVAYLYNEGLPVDSAGRKVSRNGVKAAELFCHVEALTPKIDPFTWLFIRPPWSLNGACCKETVFSFMKEYLKKKGCKKIQVCVAKTLQLLNAEEKCDEISYFLEQAASQKSGVAAYMSWCRLKSTVSLLDKAGQLESIRNLRDVASLGHIDAKLELCKYYAVCQYGGISRAKAMSFVRDFVHSVPPLNTQECFQRSHELTAPMRYILVDWLAEVAAMKLFSTHTLHVTVSVVDRFLRVSPIPRTMLQLLGVAAMVLCSRFLGTDIITIREAAWLTDNTYKYEDVVRMMGEITATLGGKLRVATSVDFAEIFNTIAGHNDRLCFLSQYICELALLQAEMGQYSPSETAASAVLLSRLLTKTGDPWPVSLQEASGFCIEDLNRCAFHMHEKCFLEGSVVDHRDVTLQAVKQRYADDDCCRVSEIEIISYKELCQLVGVTHHIVRGTDIHVRFRNDDELIVSPSRKKRRVSSRLANLVVTSTPKTPRENASTPVVESLKLNESVMSGYEGDQEDDLDDSVVFDESIEDLKREVLTDEGMGSSDKESVFSSDNTRSPQKSGFNLSAPSPFKQCLSFANCCDISPYSSTSHASVRDGQEPSTSGCSSSWSSSSSPTSFINLKSTSMTLRSATLSTGCFSSDSESAFESDYATTSKRLKSSIRSSPLHMTLRNGSRRRERRQCRGKTFIFK